LASRRRKFTLFRFALAAIAIVGVSLAPRAALAAGWHYYDPECPVALGAKTMKFVAMQPKKSIDRVCDALPETGAAVIALDAADPELRDMTWDIRILRDVDRPGADAAEGETTLRLPVQKYRNGMTNFDVDFASPGKYVLYAKMTSDDGAKEYIGRHHFTVGLLNDAELYAYAFFACFLAAVAGGFAVILRRRRKSAEGG